MRNRTRQALVALVGAGALVLAAIMSGGLAAVPAHATVGLCDAGTSVVNGVVTVTFCYNGTTGADGSPQSWTVPVGVTSVTATAYGAPGGSAFDGSVGGINTPGGNGGMVRARFSVTPGDSITVYVGGKGGDQMTVDDANYGLGGYGGGGNGHAGDATNAIFGGAGGGGGTLVEATDVGAVLAGGGGGANANAPGGAGGGANGQQGYDQVGNFAGGTGATGASGGTGQGTDGCNSGSSAAGSGADAGLVLFAQGGAGGLCKGLSYAGPGGGGGRAGGGGGTSHGAGGGSGFVEGLNPEESLGGNSMPYGWATISFTQPTTGLTLTSSETSPLDISAGAVSVQYTARVKTGTTAVTEGVVEFQQDGTDVVGCESLPVDATGAAVCEVAYLTPGAHTIDAYYTDAEGVYPNADDSTSMIVGSPPTAPSFAAPGVMLSATLGVPFSYTSPAPAGSPPPVIAPNGVVRSDSSIAYTTSGGQVTLTSPGPVGTNTVTVKVTNGLSPDATFTITIEVAKQDTSTTVVSSHNPSVYGEPVTFTATVQPSDQGDTATPSGTVSFTDGTTDFCGPVAVSVASPATTPPTGTATCTLAAGSAALAALHRSANATITAAYSGDATFSGSSGTAGQNVTLADTTTSLIVTTPPSTTAVTSSIYGQRVTLIATVSAVAPSKINPGADPDSTRAGTVKFAIDATDISGCQGIAVDASTNQATCVLDAFTNASDLASLHTGNHTLHAYYGSGPTGDYESSEGMASLTVSAASTTTYLTVTRPPSTASVTSATYGQPITLAATINANTPSTLDPLGTGRGTVVFSVDGSPIAGCQPVPIPSNTNQAVCVLNATTNSAVLAALHAGGHTLVADYSPGLAGDYAASRGSAAFTVDAAATTTTLVVTAQPSTAGITSSIYGQPITLTATVTANDPSTIDPADDPSATLSGNVVFAVDGAPIVDCNAVALSSVTNQAACVLDANTNAAVLAALHADSYSLTATFAAGADYTTSSDAVSFAVHPAPTTTTLAAVPNPAAFGEPILFTATVTQSPVSIIPPSSGVVTFDNLTTDEVPCVNVVSAGVAECGVTAGHLAAGSYAFTASYGGSGDYAASASATYTETVSAAPTVTIASAVYYDFAPGPTVAITAEVHALPPSLTDPGDTGTVSFFNGTTLLCTVPLDDNQALCEAAIDPSNTSPHSLTAIYNYDGSTANYLSSSGATDAVAHLARPTVVTVSAVSNSQAALGASWLVSGGGFSGTSAVTVCGIAVPFTVISDNTLLVGIPSVGAPRQCTIVVTAAGGAGSSNGTVTVVPQPQPGSVPVTIPGGSPSTPSATCTTATLTVAGQWTLIGWPGADTAVADALAASPDGCTTDVSSAIAVIWSFDSTSQTWLAYFPGVTVPGANDLETLQRGMGYFVALTNPGTSVSWAVEGV